MFKHRKKYTKEELAEYDAKLKEMHFEKGDLPAMIIAGILTFIPMMLVVLGVMVFIIWLFFLRS